MDTIAAKLGSDVAREAELDRLITKRHERRQAEEGHRPSEEMYEENCRKHAEQQKRENTAAWYGYLMDSAAGIERVAAQIAAAKRAEAQKLLGPREPGNDAA